MAQWNSHQLHKNMKVFSSDSVHVGHIGEVYEDSFLVHKGYFFPTDRYIPYSAIASLEDEQLNLSLNSSEMQEKQWEIRPDYEDHLADPTQLLYDRGHGLHDPFDETDAANQSAT